MSCTNCNTCGECGSDLKKNEAEPHSHVPQQYHVHEEGSGFWKWVGGFFLGWLFFG